MFKNLTKNIIKIILLCIFLAIILNIFGGIITKYYFAFHGWKFILPEKIPNKLVLVGIETIELDSLLLYSITAQLNKMNHYIITKKETFDRLFFLKSMFYVDRSRKNNLVKTVSTYLQNKDNFTFSVFPEGATRNVQKWKTGFHYIARNTKAYIGIVGIDHATKSVFIDTIFTPSDNYEKDLKFIQSRLKKYKPAIREKCNLFDKNTQVRRKNSSIGLTPIEELF